MSKFPLVNVKVGSGVSAPHMSEEHGHETHSHKTTSSSERREERQEEERKAMISFICTVVVANICSTPP